MKNRINVAEKEFRAELEKTSGFIDYDNEGYKSIINTIMTSSQKETSHMLHLFFSSYYDQLSSVGITSETIRKFLKEQYEKGEK